jgi:hypothetical protein
MHGSEEYHRLFDRVIRIDVPHVIESQQSRLLAL